MFGAPNYRLSGLCFSLKQRLVRCISVVLLGSCGAKGPVLPISKRGLFYNYINVVLTVYLRKEDETSNRNDFSFPQAILIGSSTANCGVFRHTLVEAY